MQFNNPWIMSAAQSLSGLEHLKILRLLLLSAGSGVCGLGWAKSVCNKPLLPLVTGAFVQLNDRLALKDDTWWQAELSSMKSIGMDTFIVQYVAFGKKYFYPTSIADHPSKTDSIQRF